MFIKDDISRDEKFFAFEILDPPTMFAIRIANKNTFLASRMKFIRAGIMNIA